MNATTDYPEIKSEEVGGILQRQRDIRFSRQLLGLGENDTQLRIVNLRPASSGDFERMVLKRREFLKYFPAQGSVLEEFLAVHAWVFVRFGRPFTVNYEAGMYEVELQ